MMDAGSISLARHFARRVRDMESPPPEVILAAQRSIYDTVGVMLAGRNHPVVRTLAGLPCAPGNAPLVSGGFASAETSALVNGAAAHVWDFDDTCYTGIQHASAVILPVLLGLAAERGSSPEALVRAFVAGSEIAYELGALCGDQHYFSGWWSTVTFGLIGAVAGAGCLMDLDEDALTNAIGMAGAAAGGTKSVFGSDAKPVLVGETGQRAIRFARMAGAGLTGPEAGFEGPTGFLACHDAMPLPATLPTPQWRLVTQGVLFKTNPVCSAAQAAIEAMGQVMRDTGLTPTDIDSIEVETSELVAVSLVQDAPRRPSQAQFSMPYALACTALHGKVRFQDLAPDALSDPRKQAIMARVRWAKTDRFDTAEMRATAPEPARVTIIDQSGQRHSAECLTAYGMPQRPLSETDLIEKFTTAAAFAELPNIESRINGFDPVATITVAAQS